jgi:hypothetical protein
MVPVTRRGSTVGDLDAVLHERRKCRIPIASVCRYQTASLVTFLGSDQLAGSIGLRGTSDSLCVLKMADSTSENVAASKQSGRELLERGE